MIKNLEKTNISKQNFLVLLTTQRSGSTWLFDLLRTMEGVSVHPSAKFWELLCLKGRRYPRDLSSECLDSIHTEKIEVLPGQFEYITPRSTSTCDEVSDQYFIEKMHPHFINFKFRKFAKIVNKNRLKEVKFLVHLRNPLDSIFSFMNYQKRRNWYENYKGVGIVRLFQNDLLFIEKLINCFPKDMVYLSSYEEMNRDTISYLADIEDFLWPEAGTTKSSAHAYEKIIAGNRRDVGGKPSSGFVASEEEKEQNRKEFEDFVKKYDSEVVKCNRLFERIIGKG